jgi:hypothetical protein
VKAHGPVLEQPVEGGREQVLAGVLLHVVEPAPPCDLAVHALALTERRRQDVRDLAAL